MASFWSFSAMFMALMACNCSLPLASGSRRQNIHVSTISAAPATLPGAPLVSPTPSPDIEPLFPTPGGVAYSPSESSLPTIPSSPSPPNPDVFGTPGPMLAFPPSESMSASAPASPGTSQPLYPISYLALLVICVMQLHGM